MTNIYDHKMLKEVTQEFTFITEDLWYKYSKYVNITKCSKAWWNKKYNRNLTKYWTFRRKKDWIKYRKMVKTAKQIFFYNRIQEITLTNKKLWDLMNYIKKYKLPATEAIKFNRHSCNKLDDLWQVLYQSYNAAQDRPINLQLLDKILSHQQVEWPSFSKAKFINTNIVVYQL